MRLEEFTDLTLAEELAESKVVWSRTGSKLKLKYRCTSGPKAGRIVSDATACSAPKDLKKSAQMKKTRAITKVRQAKRAKKTKRVNPASQILARLNAFSAKHAAKKKSKPVRMTSKSTRKSKKASSPTKPTRLKK